MIVKCIYKLNQSIGGVTEICYNSIWRSFLKKSILERLFQIVFNLTKSGGKVKTAPERSPSGAPALLTHTLTQLNNMKKGVVTCFL
jgi:hypothetical protein